MKYFDEKGTKSLPDVKLKAIWIILLPKAIFGIFECISTGWLRLIQYARV